MIRSIPFIFCFFIISSFQERDHLSILIDKIEDYNKRFYENIYVHTNKESYHSGDKLWFKAYVTGIGGQATQSKTLYCRLTNDLNEVFILKRFQITDGFSNGTIELGQNLKAGYYHITFFTKKSVISELSYHKDFFIGFPNSNLEAKIHQTLSSRESEYPVQCAIHTDSDYLHITIPIQTNDYSQLYLFVTAMGEVIWASEECLEVRNEVKIPNTDMPIGTVTITGLNNIGETVLKKTIAVNNKERPELTVKIDSLSPLRGDTTKVKLQLKSLSDTKTNVSVSVFVKELNFGNSESIVDYMSKSENLNLFLQDMDSVDYLEEAYYISGEAISEKGVLEGLHILALDKNAETFYEAVTDKTGSFKIKVDSTFFNSEFLVGGVDEKFSPLTIKVNDTIKVNPPLNGEQMSINSSNEGGSIDSLYLNEYLDYQFLDEIVIRNKRFELQSPGEVKLFNYFNSVKVDRLIREDISTFAGQSFLEILRQVTSIRYANWLGQVYFNRGTNPVLFVLNGIPVGYRSSDLDQITNQINDITVIKNLGAVTQFGVRAKGGVVLVSTLDAIVNLVEPHPPILQNGKIETTHFYETAQPFERSDKLESCIYWQGNVSFDENGIANIKYQNLPFSGTAIIKIEGIDNKRNFISKEIEYFVQ